jgi:hypothetical protein
MGDMAQDVTRPQECSSAEVLFKQHLHLPDELKNKAPSRTSSGFLTFVFDHLLPPVQSLLFFGLGKGTVKSKEIEHEGKTYHQFTLQAGMAKHSIVLTTYGVHVVGTTLYASLQMGNRRGVMLADEDIGVVYIPRWALLLMLSVCAVVCDKNSASLKLLRDEMRRTAFLRTTSTSEDEKKEKVVLH